MAHLSISVGGLLYTYGDLLESPKNIINSHLEHEGPGELIEYSVRVMVGGGGHIAQAPPYHTPHSLIKQEVPRKVIDNPGKN